MTTILTVSDQIFTSARILNMKSEHKDFRYAYSACDVVTTGRRDGSHGS